MQVWFLYYACKSDSCTMHASLILILCMQVWFLYYACKSDSCTMYTSLILVLCMQVWFLYYACKSDSCTMQVWFLYYAYKSDSSTMHASLILVLCMVFQSSRNVCIHILMAVQRGLVYVDRLNLIHNYIWELIKQKRWYTLYILLVVVFKEKILFQNSLDMVLITLRKVIWKMTDKSS